MHANPIICIGKTEWNHLVITAIVYICSVLIKAIIWTEQ